MAPANLNVHAYVKDIDVETSSFGDTLGKTLLARHSCETIVGMILLKSTAGMTLL
jgi:hypothetical protein